jgi:hypothetical protein
MVSAMVQGKGADILTKGDHMTAHELIEELLFAASLAGMMWLGVVLVFVL